MPENRIAADFRPQTYEGRPVLTWWEGGLIVGDGRGSGVIYDQHYRPIKTVNAGNGYSMDLHEFTLTPQGTALVIAYDRVHEDLSDLGGPADVVAVDGIVQEIDVKTGPGRLRVALARPHRPRREQDTGAEEGRQRVRLRPPELRRARRERRLHRLGPQHLGRLQDRPGHRPDRVAARRYQAESGDGPGNADRLAASRPAAARRNHHDLRQRRVTEGARRLARPHRARRRAQRHRTLVSAVEHPAHVLSATQGSAERLPNGDTFVGYGSQPRFAEYDAGGRLVFDGQLARGNDSYRAFRMPWEGSPAGPPDVVATTSGGTVTAHVSWNGATTVARWELLAGSRRDDLEPIADAAARDFEVTLRAKTTQRLIAARAIDAQGKTLAMSTPAPPR